MKRTDSGLPKKGSGASLLQAWRATLRRRGDARAVVEAATGNTCTFRELDARAEAWRVRHATETGAVRGRAVVFAVANGIEWLEIFLGLAKAGAVIVPLDAGEPSAAQRAIAEEVRAGFWWERGRLVVLPRARRFHNPATCLVKLTSGTTGRARPLVFTAAQILADARQVTATMAIRPRDLNYALIPFGHSYGLGNLTLPLIAHGVPLVCGAAAFPQAIAEDFRRWRPTVFPSVPAVWRALATATVEPEALASLRLPISAGAPLPVEVAREFEARFSRRIHSFYGSSETGGIAFDRTGRETLAGGVGRAMRGVLVRPIPGQRLRVCSPAVFTQGNRRRKNQLGCWEPGDRAHLDARGQITLMGRRGRIVKLAGRRVNLGEIVTRLRRLEGVREAWVGVSEAAEPVLGAAVVATRPAAELRAKLLAEGAAWKVPKRWAVLEQMPLTSRGKIDARGLHARVFGRP